MMSLERDPVSSEEGKAILSDVARQLAALKKKGISPLHLTEEELTKAIVQALGPEAEEAWKKQQEIVTVIQEKSAALQDMSPVCDASIDPEELQELLQNSQHTHASALTKGT